MSQPPQKVLLSWTFKDGATGNVLLDASIAEQHLITAQVTQHQVEQGPDVVDHIRPMPRKVSIEAMVSNTPIDGNPSNAGGVTGTIQTVTGTVPQPVIPNAVQAASYPRFAKFSALVFGSEFDRVRSVYADLVKAVLGGALFSVTTTLNTYDSMAVVNFAVPRNVSLGNVLRFTIDLQEIRIVKTTMVAAPAAVKKRGSQPVKDATPKQNDNSTTWYRQTHPAAGG